MFLTQMELHPGRRGTRFLLGSPQRMHAEVLAAFPRGADSGRVLWRLDAEANRRLLLYVVSAQKPDLTGIVEKAGWPATSTWRTAAYDSFLARITSGQRWAFRLTANPVRNVRSGDRPGARGRAVPHRTVGHQQQWLFDRAGRLGVGFGGGGDGGEASFAVSSRGVMEFSKAEPGADGARRRVTLSYARFDGMLEVVEPDLLRSALVSGVGGAKAYGCGLLTLALPPS